MQNIFAGRKKNGLRCNARNSNGGKLAHSSWFAAEFARSWSYTVSTALGKSKKISFYNEKLINFLLSENRKLWAISPFMLILTVAMVPWIKHLHFNISLIRQVIIILILTRTSPQASAGTFCSRYSYFRNVVFSPSLFKFLFVYYLFHVFSARGFFCLNSFWYLFFFREIRWFC